MWPLVNGKASRNAIEFSVCVIILVGISPVAILQKIQSMVMLKLDLVIKITYQGSTIVAHARPSPNFMVTLSPCFRVQFSIVLGTLS